MFFFLLILALVALFSAERNDFGNFGRGSTKEHFYDIILKSRHWPRRCRFKGFFFLFLALAAISFSGGENLSNFGRLSPKKRFYENIEIEPLT